MAASARSGFSYRYLIEKLRARLFATRVYHASLLRRPPKALRFTPEPSWPGDKERGAAILLGRFELGVEQTVVSIDPWSLEMPSADIKARLHKFEWLRDAAAAPDQERARARVQTIVHDWISLNPHWSPIVWRADVMGERIAMWLEYYDLFFAKGSKSFRALVMRSLSHQLAHLSRVWNKEADGVARIRALKGMIYGAVCIPNGDKKLIAALRKLEFEIGRQIGQDGGHAERSPGAHHQFLRHLVDLRAVLLAAQKPAPETLQSAIDRMAPLLRFYRHQDGGLSLFNGTREESAPNIDATLIKADARGQSPRSAPYAGFERLLSGRLLLLADTGAPPQREFDRFSHAGTLSFEMSVGRERVIVNCGSAQSTETPWYTAQRTTAAHSTLSIEDRNSSELLENGGIGRRPQTVSCERLDDEEHLSFTASHDGYGHAFGVVHLRQIKLAKHSELILGSDRLIGEGLHSFCIRFHLHPDVTVSIAHGGESGLFKLAKGGGWRFKVSGAAMRLEESIYLGGSRPRRSKQIVLEGVTVEGETQVDWSIFPVT